MNGIAQGCSTIAASSGAGFSNAMALCSILVGLGLLLGFLTPVAGAIATFGYLVGGVTLLIASDLGKHTSAFSALDLAVMSLTLVLLGPGAFSLDARLFGRREIIIPDGRRSGL